MENSTGLDGPMGRLYKGIVFMTSMERGVIAASAYIHGTGILH